MSPMLRVVLHKQRELRVLRANHTTWLDRGVADRLAKLTDLHRLELRGTPDADAICEPLAASPSLREIDLTFAEGLTVDGVRMLGALPLTDLDIYGTKLVDDVRDLVMPWTDCRVRLPGGAVLHDR